MKIIVTDEALRELVNEALGGVGYTAPGDDDNPVVVNDVVDPSAAETDVKHDNFVPQNKRELVPAFRSMIADNDIEDEDVPDTYTAVSAAIAADKERRKMKTTKGANNKAVEEAIRKVVRGMLAEIGYGQGGRAGAMAYSGPDVFADSDDDDEREEKAKARRVKKDTGGLAKKENERLSRIIERGEMVVDPMDAIWYREIVEKTFKLLVSSGEVEEKDFDDLLRYITTTKTFTKMFEDEMGEPYREYMLHLGRKIKTAMMELFTVSKNTKGEEAEDVNLGDIGKAWGKSTSEVVNIDNIALAKFALHYISGLGLHTLSHARRVRSVEAKKRYVTFMTRAVNALDQGEDMQQMISRLVGEPESALGESASKKK